MQLTSVEALFPKPAAEFFFIVLPYPKFRMITVIVNPTSRNQITPEFFTIMYSNVVISIPLDGDVHVGRPSAG